jgi:hypothetical protein
MRNPAPRPVQITLRRATGGVAAVAMGLFLTFTTPAVSAQTVTQISDGGETGTESVTTTTDASGNTVTTTVKDLEGPIAGPAQPGATYQTDRDVVAVTKDPNGHEIERSVTHVHENLDKKGGNQLSKTTRDETVHTNWTAGTRTDRSTTMVDNDVTGQSETSEYATSSSLVTYPTTHWEQDTGHQTVTKKQPGKEPKKAERDFDPASGTWTGLHEAGSPAALETPRAAPRPPTPLKTLPPLDNDPRFQTIEPHPSAGNEPADEQAYVPPVAGPGSEIVATYVDPEQSGPSDVIVGIVTDDGTSTYYQGHTDPDHKLHFTLPEEIGGALVTGFLLSKGFDPAGHPDGGTARTIVTRDGPIPNTEIIPNAPSAGPAIVSGSTAYDRTPGKGLVRIGTSGISPEDTQLELDGKSDGIVTRAVSNRSVLGELSGDVPLGRHTIGVTSSSVRSNAFETAIVELHAQPLPPTLVGRTVPLVVGVTGLGNERATMTFAVGGAATLADGSESTIVDVQNGVARADIRGVHAGQAIVHYGLHVELSRPNFLSSAITSIGKNGTTLTHPGSDGSTTVDPKTGITGLRDPATGTSVSVDPKKRTTTAKDDKTGKTTTATHKEPGTSSSGGGQGEPKVDVDTTQQQNPGGTTTTTSKLTVTNNGSSTNVTVTTTTDANGGQTTTVTDPADSDSSTWTTVDKEGDVTSSGTITKNPDGTKTETTTDPKTGATTITGPSGSYTVIPNADGTLQVDYTTPSGQRGAFTAPAGSVISPNTPDATNPLPFTLSPASPAK